MHTISLKTLLVVALATVILAACGGQNTATLQPTTKVEPTPAVQQTEKAQPAAVEPGSPPTATNAPAAASPVSFGQDVLPILQASCTKCHGETRQSGGLALNSYQALMRGAQGGAVIIPNDAAASVLVGLVTSGQMPRSGAKLTEAQVQLIREWIDAGAADN